MSEVFLCEKGQLTDASKGALRKAGVVVVEVVDPSKCQFIRSSETIPHDQMMWAAIDALNTQWGDKAATAIAQRERFVKNIGDIVARSMGLTPVATP